MILTPQELQDKLPLREFWFVNELAEAFNVGKRAIQYCAKRKGIGRKVRQGPNGLYIFFLEDLPKVCEHIHGEVGNPVNKKIYAERQARKAKK